MQRGPGRSDAFLATPHTDSVIDAKRAARIVALLARLCIRCFGNMLARLLARRIPASPMLQLSIGAPEEIRTPDPQIRSLLPLAYLSWLITASFTFPLPSAGRAYLRPLSPIM
jgi:hypothetical protein